MNKIGANVLTILLIAVFVIVCLAIEYVIRRGLNKSFDKIHNIRKHRKAAANPRGRFRLADRYNNLDYTVSRGTVKRSNQAANSIVADDWEMEDDSATNDEWEIEEEPQPASEPEPRPVAQSVSRPSQHASSHEVLKTTPSAAVSLKSRTPQQPTQILDSHPPLFDIPETIPPFQENRCCICNGELCGKYAVLFKADSGAEARIDRDCAVKFNTIVKGTDPQEIVEAGRYMLSRYDAVDPKVAPYLKKYAKVAYDRLKQWKESGQ